MIRSAGFIGSAVLSGVISLGVAAAALADTTVLVGTAGTANSTLTSGIRSFAVTNSGSTWTQSAFNSDGWTQTMTAGVNGPWGNHRPSGLAQARRRGLRCFHPNCFLSGL